MSGIYGIFFNNGNLSDGRAREYGKILSDGLLHYGSADFGEEEIFFPSPDGRLGPVPDTPDGRLGPVPDTPDGRLGPVPDTPDGFRIFLGCRLSHLHEGVPAGSPIIRTAKYAAAADAMIYNRYDFTYDDMAALSDGQLLIRVYEDEGTAGLLRIDGDFAAICADLKTGGLTLLRDHLGIRPLYLMQGDGFETAATDYRPFFRLPCAHGGIDESSFYAFLTSGKNASETQTLFENVKKVTHGSIMIRDSSASSWVTNRFWIPGKQHVKKQPSDNAYIEMARNLILDSIRIRRAALGGLPFGAEFSGGIDSGMVCGALNTMAKKDGKALPLLVSWSPSLSDYPLIVDDSESGLMDERTVIEEFCRLYGNKCIYQNSRETKKLEKILGALKEPQICEYDTYIIREGIHSFRMNGDVAAFSGWGGDEGISMRFGPYHLLQAHEPAAFLKEASLYSNGSLRHFLGFIRRSLKAISNSKRPWDPLKSQNLTIRLFHPQFSERMEKNFTRDPLYFGSQPELVFMTGNLETRPLLTASIGADAGVTYLFPLLDPRLVDFALTIPAHLFYENGTQRVLPQKAMKDFLPESLRSFAGKGDAEKRDIGRMRLFMEQETSVDRELLPWLFSHLDRGLFSPYLDFDKIKEYIEEEKDPGVLAYIREKLTASYKIQILLQPQSPDIAP